MRWIISLLEWLNLGWVLLTILAYFAPFISPEAFWPAAVAASGYPALLLGHFLFILFWLLLRSRFAGLSIVAVLIGWNALCGLVGFRLPTAPPVDGLRVVTFNTHNFRHSTAEEPLVSEAELDAVTKYFSTDILALQEHRAVQVEHYINQWLIKRVGLDHHVSLPAKGIATFSAYPIRAHATHHFENKANGYQWTDIAVGDSTVLRLFNVHLQSTAVSGVANEVVQEGNLQERKTWGQLRYMLRRYKGAAIIRAQQAREVAAAIAESPHPVIVCGDFNEPPLSYAYRTISEGLQDAFREKGSGLGTTFDGAIPGLRIDYVLVDSRLSVTGFQLGRTPFSDHYPVFVGVE